MRKYFHLPTWFRYVAAVLSIIVYTLQFYIVQFYIDVLSQDISPKLDNFCIVSVPEMPYNKISL